jgi:hypothetical protein
VSLPVQSVASNFNSILNRIERLLSELSVHDDDEKRRQVLNLLDSLSKSVAQLSATKKLLRPTGEAVKSFSEILTPLYVRISRMRLSVLGRSYEEAMRELHVIDTFEGGQEPGLMPLCNMIVSLLSLATQEITPEEAAPLVPEVTLTPPADLLYGVPPVTILLWNLLVRRGRLEKEEAKRALIPVTAQAPEQLEKEFEEAWDILVDRGYAEQKIDKRGNIFLVRK